MNQSVEQNIGSNDQAINEKARNTKDVTGEKTASAVVEETVVSKPIIPELYRIDGKDLDSFNRDVMLYRYRWSEFDQLLSRPDSTIQQLVEFLVQKKRSKNFIYNIVVGYCDKHKLGNVNKEKFINLYKSIKSDPSLRIPQRLQCSPTSNTWTEYFNDKDKPVKHKISIHGIAQSIRTSTQWPCVCNGKLFADDNGKIIFLDKPEALFAFCQQKDVRHTWDEGKDCDGLTPVSRKELFSYLHGHVQEYAAICELPHEPRIPKYYYSYRAPRNYTPTGEYFNQLLLFFDNGEVPEVDNALIRAMFMTPFWGCEPGCRPVFCIHANESQSGKSTLAETLATITGGYISYTPQKQNDFNGIDNLISRILSSAQHRGKRIINIDNYRGFLNDQGLERFITQEVISGKENYCGESQTPNNFMVVMTTNGFTTTIDFTNRMYVINLLHPSRYDPLWETRLKAFVKKNRLLIVEDILAILRNEDRPLSVYDSWSQFNLGVLSKATDNAEFVINENEKRRKKYREVLHIADPIEVFLNGLFDLDCNEESSDTGKCWFSYEEAKKIFEDTVHRGISTQALKQSLTTYQQSNQTIYLELDKRKNNINGFVINC